MTDGEAADLVVQVTWREAPRHDGGLSMATTDGMVRQALGDLDARLDHWRKTLATISESWQRERHDIVTHLRPEGAVTTRGNDDELLAALRAVRHWRCLGARRQITPPE